MVRSKDVPKKPRDPLLTPPSKLSGVGFLGDGGRVSNRGSAAMSPAPASVPNYMRGTSSSDAKGGSRRARLAATAAPASASPARRRTAPAVRVVSRGKVLFPEAPGSGSGRVLGRATCSSTLKGAKFPDALDLAPGATDAKGPATMRVCPYTYCSLNGHAHAPAVPLRSFLASRRRRIKTQQSMKLKGVSAFRKKSGDKNDAGDAAAGTSVVAAKIAPLIDVEAVGDFFVEVYAGPRLSSGSDMSLDEMDATPRKMEFLVFDRCGADEDGEKGEDPAVCGDSERDGRLGAKDGVGAYGFSSSVCSDAVISGDFIEELPWLRYHGSEYDSLDDGITEEQRMRNDEIDEAQISEEQGDNSNEGTSDELGDECVQEAAEEDEANDEDNISSSVLQSEIAGEQEGDVCRVEACHELDRRDEDTISGALCDREPSAGQAQISEEQGGNSNKGTSDELGDECEQEAAEEHEANDEDSISNSVLQSEIAGELEGVVCRVEACQELDTRDEDSILDSLCHGEPSAEQATEEGRFSDAVHKSDIPDRDVAEREGSTSILEESCFEETSADQDAEVSRSVHDESSVKSDGGSEVIPDDGSEMEISDDTISNDGFGCVEDFSEEVTSKTVSAEHVFEQHDSIADENAQRTGQKESGITTREIENASEGSGIVCSIMDTMEDSQKEMEVTTYEKEETCEESDTAHGSNPDNMELKVTICMSKDASVESDGSQGSTLDGNGEYVEVGTEIGPEITRCKLEDSYEEPGMDQGTVEDDDYVCVKDAAQNDDSGMAECRSESDSKDSFTIQEAEQSDSPANARSGGQNESNHTTSELALGIIEDTENESKPTTCQPEDVSEKSAIGQEADHDGSSANIMDDTQNESDLRIFESEAAQECSDVVKGDKSKDNSADSEKELENAACESGGASKRAAMFQEADSAQKDITLLKLDASEDIQTVEETNELFHVEIPEAKSDCTVEGHVEPQNITAEVSDAKEPSVDDICDTFKGMNLKGDVYFDPDESATCPRNKLIISRRRRTPEEEEYLHGFNPRAPNFLPVELDPDAEKVDLRHQMVDERKNAEEWMIDYALRRALTNLAPARKKKVELLVQAFETVLPHDEDDRKSVTPPRPVQSCN